jgi:uncharacterized protein YrrD
MLRHAKSIRGFAINAVDGQIGVIDQLFFDDSEWFIRYIVVRTGGWLIRKEVLISPMSIKALDFEHERVDVQLSRAQIENSPDIDTHKPVSRQMEVAFYNYFGWPYYWTRAGAWVSWPVPGRLRMPSIGEIGGSEREPEEQSQSDDAHLRSSEEVSDYRIRARDCDFGHVTDIVFDDESWRIRYFVVDLVNWWPSKSVLLPAEWIGEISWNEMRFKVDMDSKRIKTIQKRAA